jgi:hypothetical protein
VFRILYPVKVKSKASCSGSKSRVSEPVPETDWREHSLEAETGVSHARGSQGVKAWHNSPSGGPWRAKGGDTHPQQATEGPQEALRRFVCESLFPTPSVLHPKILFLQPTLLC